MSSESHRTDTALMPDSRSQQSRETKSALKPSKVSVISKPGVPVKKVSKHRFYLEYWVDFLSETVVETRSGPKRPRPCVDVF